MGLTEQTALPVHSGWGCRPNVIRWVDYYEIALVEYAEKMHSDLPPTKLRGYVQLATSVVPPVPLLLGSLSQMAPPVGVDKPHYLGPIIVAREGSRPRGNGPGGRPEAGRITFYNLLPNSDAGGNLWLPVDETVPGSGVGPCLSGAGERYPQNRATIHLHGNNTVWISDGNTHQWITPATEITAYPAGVSARNVPDMDPGCDADPAAPGLPGNAAGRKSSGCMTFYYTNAQSARLQFYHDHAHGITRLNVYAGEAAGYVVTDAVEQDMLNGTNRTGIYGLPADPTGTVSHAPVLPDIGIPLVIQDKTWVDADTIYAQDPTWNWGDGRARRRQDRRSVIPTST